MNERIQKLADQAEDYADSIVDQGGEFHTAYTRKLAELIVEECAEICMEMSAKCAGLPGDGSLAKDCAYWIKKDFGVDK